METVDAIYAHLGEIVSAYVSNNAVPHAELPRVIAAVHKALEDVKSPRILPEAAVQKEPAVSVRKSVHADYLICLEDGRKFKSLRLHLNTSHELTAEAYRLKWDLPVDYPMVSANYANKRSKTAKSIELGLLASHKAEPPQSKASVAITKKNQYRQRRAQSSDTTK